MSVSVALQPSPIAQFFTVNGVPLSGGKLFAYQAGTTTKINTYTDSSGATPQTNPIILNSRGEPENNLGSSVGLWLQTGLLYKLVLAPSTDTDPPTNPIWTIDNVGAGATPIVGTFGSGTGTYTPPAGTSWLRVKMLAGGGGGGGSGSSAAGAGGTGGNTSFGALTANGGIGAVAGPSAGGAGGAMAAGATVLSLGGASGNPSISGVTNNLAGGAGANSALGGAGAGGFGTNGLVGVSNTGGGGGGGSGNTGVVGAAGGGAGGYVETIITSPIPVTYSVGAGGAGGVAGTSGFAGGSGGGGFLTIEAYL